MPQRQPCLLISVAFSQGEAFPQGPTPANLSFLSLRKPPGRCLACGEHRTDTNPSHRPSFYQSRTRRCNYSLGNAWQLHLETSPQDRHRRLLPARVARRWRYSTHLLPLLPGHLSFVIGIAFVPQDHLLDIGRGVLRHKHTTGFALGAHAHTEALTCRCWCSAGFPQPMSQWVSCITTAPRPLAAAGTHHPSGPLVHPSVTAHHDIPGSLSLILLHLVPFKFKRSSTHLKQWSSSYFERQKHHL